MKSLIQIINEVKFIDGIHKIEIKLFKKKFFIIPNIIIMYLKHNHNNNVIDNIIFILGFCIHYVEIKLISID